MLSEVTNSMMRPSENGVNCLGNGEHEGYELSCDNCDFYLCCYEVRGFDRPRREDCGGCRHILHCVIL